MKLITMICCIIGAMSKDILFIGNSFTSVNNIPNMVQKMGKNITSYSSTFGAATWITHNSNAYTNEMITSRRWDTVVFQEQSKFLSLPKWQYNVYSVPSIKSLVEKATPFTDNIILFETWGYRWGNGPYDTYDNMQNRLRSGYEDIKNILNNPKVRIAYCGEEWRRATKRYSGGKLWQSDGQHPKKLGSKIAARVIYEEITHLKSSDLKLDSETELDEEF